MAVESVGAWGPRMHSYFEEMHENLKNASGLKKSPELRYAREMVSIAAAKASNCNVYLHRMRYGVPKTKSDEGLTQPETA